MSRIGNLPISLPSGVDVTVSTENLVTVKGPKGELQQSVHPKITINNKNGQLNISRSDNSGEVRSHHGLSRALINNMVIGVSEGFQIDLELIGVGYRAQANGQQLELWLGFSHTVLFVLPKEIKVTVTTEKGKAPMVSLWSIDKQLVGMIAAKVRSYRKPEPYKGKGILYKGEVIRRKAGKTAAAQ